VFKRFTAGVAVGYVMGARAGQKRYEQITDLAERAMEIPFVERLADSGRTTVMDQGREVLMRLKDRVMPSDDHDDEERDDSDEVDDDYDDDVEDEYDDGEDEEGDDSDAEEDEPMDDEAEDDTEPLDEFDDDVEGEDQDEDSGSQDEDSGSQDEDEEPRRRSRPRGRIGSLASAARERGKVA
jgi:hypothetical protein